MFEVVEWVWVATTQRAIFPWEIEPGYFWKFLTMWVSQLFEFRIYGMATWFSVFYTCSHLNKPLEEKLQHQNRPWEAIVLIRIYINIQYTRSPWLTALS